MSTNQDSRETVLTAQLTRVTLDTRGALKVEVQVPLHEAADAARDLLRNYGLNVELRLPRPRDSLI